MSIEQVFCSFSINGDVPDEIQLTLSGEIDAKDGRKWHVSKSSFDKIIAFFSGRKDDLVIDYNHASELLDKGGEAPAAGWFSPSGLVWREGVGIFATGVQWTEKAKQAILNKEYKYISPAMLIDKATREVTGFTSAALVTTPAIDGMKALANFQLNKTESDVDEEQNSIAEFAKQLVGATDGDKVIELLTKLKNEKETLEAELATVRADNETVVAMLQSNLDAKTIELETNKVKSAVQLARSQGKIVNDKDVAEFAKAGFSFVQRYLGGLKVESALAGMQTQNSRIYAEIAASNLGTPDGFDVDLSRVDLHNRATQYAKAHNVSYTVAIKQVSNG